MTASVTKIGEEALSSPEWVTSAVSALDGDGRVVDNARGVMKEPVARSPTAAGAHSSGGGLPERLRWHRTVDSAREALT